MSLPEVKELKVGAVTATSISIAWGVTNTSYLTGFELLVKSAGAVVYRVTLPPTAREERAEGLKAGTIYELNVRCIVEVGGKQVSATTPQTPPPPPPPPPSGMKVGLDSGGWWLTNDAALTAGKCKLMRGQNMNVETLVLHESKGYTMIDLIGHNPPTGVNAESLANEAIARAKAHPAIVATEILNEPQNPYLGGSESQASIEAYAKLVNHVCDAFLTAYAGRPMPALLWSCDGGYAGVPSWGAKVWPLLNANAKRSGSPTCHPYGGTRERAKSALGGRKRVEEAHALTGLPVWVTEVGWPTAVGQPPTGDSLQWTEAEQAANIENFLKWAPPFCAAVIVFQYRDYSPANWYGIESSTGRHKQSYDVMQRMA